MRITIRKKSNPAHTRLSIWVNGGLISNPFGICLKEDELNEFLARLKPDSITDEDEKRKASPRCPTEEGDKEEADESAKPECLIPRYGPHVWK